VNVSLETIPDPVQIHYHLPSGLDLKVHQDYENSCRADGYFPHERQGIRRFYDECWKVFNCLNRMELLSLEEPRYLTRVFFQPVGLSWFGGTCRRTLVTWRGATSAIHSY